MQVKEPFYLNQLGEPTMRLGSGASLSLIDTTIGPENRDIADFILFFPDGSTYRDNTLRSGAGGFRSRVEIFASFLGFLMAAQESKNCRLHLNLIVGNEDLFPAWVLDECESLNIDAVQYSLYTEDGDINHSLIQENHYVFLVESK